MITRAQMPRQLRNRGGMSVKTIRQKYGIGSFVKERIRKLIPNELADIAVKAAPIVAPFNPLVGAAMRGIGRFDQRGSVSDALKQAAATGALGIGVRKLGGAQDIIGLGSRGDRFTSPLSAERSEALSALFEGGEKAKTVDETKKGIGVVRSATEKTLGKIPIVRELPPLVQQQILVGGASAAASAVASFFKGEFREHDPETETFEEYLAQRKKVVGSQMRTYFDNYFKFDKDYSTMTDEEKDQFVARYNVAKGGRIGFQEGSKDAKSSVEFTREELGLGPLKINQEIDKLLKEGVDIEIIKSMTGAPDELIQERIKIIRFSKAKGGIARLSFQDGGSFPLEGYGIGTYNADKTLVQVGYAPGGIASYKTPEEAAAMGIFPIRKEDQDLISLTGSGLLNQAAIIESQKAAGAESALDILKQSMPQTQTQTTLPTGGGLGSRIRSAIRRVEPETTTPTRDTVPQQTTGTGLGFLRTIPREVLDPVPTNDPFANFLGADRLPVITQSRSLRENVATNEERRRRNQELLDAAKKRLQKKKGGVMSIPVRKNSAGVKELDMRKSGGFVPIGVKEKADDVPAMLSLNEFVMTADAVRGAGDGNINKGAQRMYDTMKKLESRVG